MFRFREVEGINGEFWEFLLGDPSRVGVRPLTSLKNKRVRAASGPDSSAVYKVSTRKPRFASMQLEKLTLSVPERTFIGLYILAKVILRAILDEGLKTTPVEKAICLGTTSVAAEGSSMSWWSLSFVRTSPFL
jgi:hypothetical protein